MSWIRTAGSLISETYGEWTRDQAPRLGAALAYYWRHLLLIAISTGLHLPDGVPSATGSSPS